jgi:hypothetical protein
MLNEKNDLLIFVVRHILIGFTAYSKISYFCMKIMLHYIHQITITAYVS